MEKDLKSIRPYFYILTRLSDGVNYHGVRWANVKKKLAPLQDLGISYFSSHKVLSKEFKNNKDNFQFKVTKIFSNKEEAIIFEKNINKKLIYNKNWANKQAFPAINNKIPPMLGKKHTEETKKKFRKRKQTDETKRKISILKKNMSNETKKKIGLAALGRKQSVKTKKKISEAMKGKKNTLGKAMSKDHKNKISEANKGKIRSSETRLKLSKAKKGTKMSELTKLKMSIAQKGREKISESTRKNMSDAQKKRWNDN